jgi:hypothetical protein
VWLSCSCALAVADGWCQHELALLRGRMDGIADPAALKVFRQIVDGTRVQEAGAAWLPSLAGAHLNRRR